MEGILNYIYQTWRTGEFGYFGIGIGILVAIIFITSLIIVLHYSGREQ